MDFSISVTLPHKPDLFSNLLSSEKICKRVYNILIQKLYRRPGCEERWEVKINAVFTDVWWRKAYALSCNFTVDTKLKWFQIRLVHRIISTNSFLCKMCVNNSDLCTFCKSHSEDLCHLFWSCTIVKSFWRSVSGWILEKTGIDLNLNLTSVIFGKFDADSVTNLIICLVKQHIYKRRL